MANKEIPMEGAPDWYGTHYNDLNFEWSPEEEVEIERYCEKIQKNTEEEEMTPLERWKAHMAGKPKDRKLICCNSVIVYSTRTLDGYADALKPIDLYKSPKLLVKALLATMARFKLDYLSQNITNYTEDLWGGRSKMIEYGNPSAIGDRPVKSLEDLEGIEVPDPYSAGLTPGWLWVNKEFRRIVDKYQLSIPLWASLGPDPTCLAILGVMGWTPFLKAMINDKELARRSAALGVEWTTKLSKALIEVSKPEGLYLCQFTGCFPLTGNEWVADQLAELAKAIKSIDPQVLSAAA